MHNRPACRDNSRIPASGRNRYGAYVTPANDPKPRVDADAIRVLAATGESEVLEFKATTGQKDDAAKALCGMLNGSGGQVLFGVTPSGEVVGQQVADKTLEDLAATIRGIKPETQPHIDRVPVSADRTVLVVTATPGMFRPYTYRGSAYRRIGATTVKMTADEQQSLLLEQVHGSSRWEDEPSPLTLDELDLRELTARVAEGRRRSRIGSTASDDPQHILLALRLWARNGPTHAAAVLFGKPDAIERHYVQVAARLAAFQGLTETAPFDEIRLVHDNAFGLLAAIERFIGGHLRIRSELREDSFYRIDTPEIPALAMREAIVNALAHREYHDHSGSIMVRVFDDRVQIISNGGLHFGLRPDELFQPHGARPWNPNIAQTLYRVGLVDTMGTGTLRMIDLVRDHGLPLPVIEDNGHAVTVTFTRPGYPPPALVPLGLTNRQWRILELIATGQPIARAELVSRSGEGERLVRRTLDQLADQGLATYRGERRGARWHLDGAARNAYGLPPLPE